ncbi:MAG TPA: hypothetical protein VF244_03070, partial [Acidimicrobiales bacterium]
MNQGRQSEEVVPGLAEAIERRRIERGLTPGAFAEAAGVTPQGLVPLRKGYRRRYREKLKIGVCEALGWTADSIDLLLEGRLPVGATEYGVVLRGLNDGGFATRGEIQRLDEQIRELRGLLGSAIVIDLDQLDIVASPEDGGTLRFAGEFPVHETGAEVVYLLKGSRARVDELSRRLRGEHADRD